MKVFTGIDLGSTTTKAVILDEDGQVLGRGITNSRSNYDTACAVARTEARVAARFELLRRRIEGDDRLRRHSGEILPALLRAFRLEQYLEQLDCLATTAYEIVDKERSVSAPAASGDHECSCDHGGGVGTARATHKEMRTALATIFGAMVEEAPSLFRPGVAQKSDFFRDLAGSRFQDLAAVHRHLGFDRLLAVFDRGILHVENTVLDLSFEVHIDRALQRCLREQAWSQHREALQAAVRGAVGQPLDEACTVGTGYGRARLPFPREQIRSEILCHGLGAHHMFPGTATVLDIGGQDTKAIQVDPNGLVTCFQMNDRCAAGCGRYLGYIADEMNLGVHELGPLAMQAGRTVRINSTCTVFAGAELRERLHLGEKREDILAGLHRAIILRAMSLLARSGGIKNEFTFTGGVARNPAAVNALRLLVEENYGKVTFNISPDSIYTGSLGAALFARREVVR